MVSRTGKHRKCLPCQQQEQRYIEHVHRKSTAILDACFHADMDELIRAHPPRETEPEYVVVWCLSRAHCGARRVARARTSFFRNEVFVIAGGNAQAMEPNAHHKAEYWDDDSTSTVEHSDSFMEELRMDIKSATIIETATKIVKQVSNWRPAGITWVRWGPRAAVLTPNTAATTRTTRNALNELSWDRAKPRSLADGTETYLVLKRLIARDSQELIERIGHETVNENLKNVMDNTNSEVNSGVSSEEPEFAWTVICQTTMQKSVSKTDTN